MHDDSAKFDSGTQPHEHEVYNPMQSIHKHIIGRKIDSPPDRSGHAVWGLEANGHPSLMDV